MARNDVILLDGIIDQRVAAAWPSTERDEVFEFLVLDEVLKDYDLSREEIESGWIDGRDDGGIDGFYIVVNGHLLDEVADFVWPRTHAAIDAWIVTCKHHATFRQGPLDAILATIQELFDLSVSAEDLRGSYSSELLDARALFHVAYRKLSIGRPLVHFHFVYGSRGDSHEIGTSVAARATQIEGTISELFSSSSVEFRFVGAAELVALHRKSKTFALNLPFVEHLATGKDSYVLLVRLEDYWRFVTDENGHLRRYLFDSNVRDFLGTAGVNDDIARSLKDETGPDFWWLNNGVTILATNATVPGKTIQLQDIQIVNGLQTTETIFRHFSDGSPESRQRSLLVKIIVSSDPAARDQIIRATNNQSPVEIAALHATDKVQRDIEDILERHAWYDERRKNYYRNIGKPHARFVTPIYLASAMISLVLRNPALATKLKSKFMRNQSSYDAVFSPTLPINVWPVLVEVYKHVDSELLLIAASGKKGERFLVSWRPLVSLLVLARTLGSFSYTTHQLAELKIHCIDATAVSAAWRLIARVQEQQQLEQTPKRFGNIKHSFFKMFCREAADEWTLDGVEQIGRRGIAAFPSPQVNRIAVSDDFINEVDSVLPPQPWKPGMSHDVAAKLERAPREVSAAIQHLISDGRRYNQRDGIVYDTEGVVITFDATRAPHLLDELA